MKLESVRLVTPHHGDTTGKYANGFGYYRATNSEVRAYHYPFCCTGAILANLGGSQDSYDEEEPIEGLEEQLEAWIEAIGAGHMRQDKSFISVSTTDEQEEANEALEAVGFVRSPAIENVVNQYDLILWTYTYGEVHDA